jgi:hypothetical protein
LENSLKKWDYLIEALLVSRAKHFDDLFSAAKPWKHGGRPPNGWTKHWAVVAFDSVTGHEELDITNIGPFCSVSAINTPTNSLWVNPRPFLVEIIKKNTVEGIDPNITFAIHKNNYKPDAAKVSCRYGSILGGRDLANITWSSVPHQPS